MALVFQYGSNTCSKRLNCTCRLDGAAKPVGLARTQDRFDLAFTHYSKCNQCGTADLRPNGSRQIYGVLYQIANDRIYRSASGGATTLDEIEGEGTAYERTTIPVIIAAPPHDSCEAITYLVKSPCVGVKTSAEYISHIIKGLREHGAPDEYVAYVKRCAIENNGNLACQLEEL